jgi:hypothetical protein
MLASSAEPATDIACEIRVFTTTTDFIKRQVVSFIKRP